MDKRQRRRGLSIRFKVIFAICFVAFTIICVDTVISYINDYNLLRKIISEDCEEIAKQLSSAVSGIISEEIQDAKIYISNLTQIETIAPENLRLAQELKSIMKKNLDIAEMLIANKYGELIAASGKTTDFHQADEKWWKELFKPNAQKVYIGGIEHDESSKTLNFVLAIPIMNKTKDIIGACKIVLHAEKVLAPIADFKFKETGHAVLVNREGHMVYHKDFKALGKSFLSNIEDWKDFRGKASGTAILDAPHTHDKKVFVSYAMVNNNLLLNNNIEWTVFVGQDMDEAFNPLFLFATQELFLLGILTVVLIVLGFIYGTILIKPIKNITIGTQYIGKGNLDYRIDVRSSDEFGLLADEINDMASNLKESTASIDILNKEIKMQEKIDKMKDEFVSTVSHELRTPLSITKEGIALVLDEVPGKINDGQRKILTMGRNNIDRLARIINDLLDISKIESGKTEIKKRIVNISSLIKGICENWILEFDKENRNLKLHLPKTPVDIHADYDKISQIMNNLISNALKFTPEKGDVDIYVKDVGDSAEITVTDTGIGISKKDIPRLFTKFQQFGRTVGPGAKGTGLGLAIVKRLVELHGGEIKVESKLRKGTSFIFTIPKR